MFKNQSSFVDEKSKNNQELSQEKDYVIDNIPIHTMEKDIQEIENPALKKDLYIGKNPIKDSFSELSEKQKSSPFLNQSNSGDIKLKTNPDYSQLNKAIQPKIDALPKNNKPSSSGYVFAIIIILILMLAGAGTYYFIMLKKAPIEDVAINNTDTKTETNQPKNNTLINATKPNYFIIDTATIDPPSMRLALEKNTRNALESKIYTPIEFVVVDKQNNPIGFNDFSKMLGLTLPDKLVSSLDKNFSLFVFNDNGNPGIGLSLTAPDATVSSDYINQEEISLYKELLPLLPIQNFPMPPTNSFQSSPYKKYNVRYQNLLSPQKLSIDYTIFDNKIVFATTKLTMEAILDTSIQK